ncbi:GNAT family N-acetyltransferase [Paracoccus broussonetiae]|nr:GNAT family N-acetyltransferase [Paracoccus sp. CPCC 101403]
MAKVAGHDEGLPMRDMEIRRLTPDEFPIFKAIRLEALGSEPAAYASSAGDWARLSDEEWRGRLQIPVFVAFRAGNPVGIMGLLPQQASKMKHRATLIMVYLRPEERGGGAAQALLDALIAEARKAGISQIELNVSCRNPRAIRFYERSGFDRIGIIPAGMIHEGQEIDEMIMARRLA